MVLVLMSSMFFAYSDLERGQRNCFLKLIHSFSSRAGPQRVQIVGVRVSLSFRSSVLLHVPVHDLTRSLYCNLLNTSICSTC